MLKMLALCALLPVFLTANQSPLRIEIVKEMATYRLAQALLNASHLSDQEIVQQVHQEYWNDLHKAHQANKKQSYLFFLLQSLIFFEFSGKNTVRNLRERLQNHLERQAIKANIDYIILNGVRILLSDHNLRS